MPLPIVTLPIVERWDCHQCGICCRGSTVPLDAADLALLEEQGWQQRPEFRSVKITVPLDDGRRGQQLNKRADGSCVFLQADGLCLIHKELGFDAKPLICRMFPLQLVPHEKQAVLTLRRACPSAAADKGREVSEYLREVRTNATERKLVEEPGWAPAIKQGDAVNDWKRARIVLEALRRLTGDERYPPVRRLVHGLMLCQLLEQAKFEAFDNAKLIELVNVLESLVIEEAAPQFAERKRPSGAAKTLFRQTALEVVRLHPSCYVEASWGTRLRMIGWALTMVRGKGTLPQVHPGFPRPTFAELEEPLGNLSPEIYEALGRYFTTTTASYQYALAQRVGWSLLESYRQLALLYPLALWLLRWATAGRTATADDLYNIIAAIDRSQGYAPLAGARQRARLASLAQLEELTTLVAWYGR
jgi:lysine-N-methylase